MSNKNDRKSKYRLQCLYRAAHSRTKLLLLAHIAAVPPAFSCSQAENINHRAQPCDSTGTLLRIKNCQAHKYSITNKNQSRSKLTETGATNINMQRKYYSYDKHSGVGGGQCWYCRENITVTIQQAQSSRYLHKPWWLTHTEKSYTL